MIIYILSICLPNEKFVLLVNIFAKKIMFRDKKRE